MVDIEEITEIRRHLHQHPELSLQEHETTRFIIKQIETLKIEYFTPLDTGVIAIIRGNTDKTIAFRADIDALPIDEHNEVPYQSIIPNVMHACGHDGHTTMLLALMKEIKHLSDQQPLKYSYMFIFQPSEEANAGANLLIQNFNFDQFNIQAIYGIHMMPDNPEGEIAYRSNEITASATEYRFYIEGQSAHVANKEQGHAASNALIQILNQVSSLQQFHLPGLNRNIVHIGKFNAGEAINTVPSTGYLEGTIRTYSENDLSVVKQKMTEIANGIAITSGCKIDIAFTAGYPPTINDGSLEQRVISAIRDAKLIPVYNDLPYLFGEDFSYYASLAPTYFVFLGCRNTDKGYINGLHHNQFNFDELVLLNGIQYYKSLVRSYEHECEMGNQ